MKTWFQQLKVSQKLMLISIFFVMPDSLMLYLFITSINGHIQFARMEEKGNAYQRPLEELLELLPQHRQMAERAHPEQPPATPELEAKQKQIDEAFDRLEAVDARIGQDLQFTEAGLAKRKREHYRAHTVRREWEELKRRVAGREALGPEAAAPHEHLLADMRMMITHAGDLSNLILDPDLDSYYLMDATLLALPQTQDRLAAVIAHGDKVLRQGAINEEERRRLAIYATLLQESDLERIQGSVQTALNEDANFYDQSPTLQARVPGALKKYVEETKAFILLSNLLVTQGTDAVSADDFVEAGQRARAASFQLWWVASEELDRLLHIRIHDYEFRRSRSLFVAALAALAACGFVTFITRSISGPLKAQAQALQQANALLEAEVAERKRAEEELRHSETQLAAAQSIAQMGSWEWEPETGAMSWSEENYRIHGLPAGERQLSFEEALRLVHPEDRTHTAQALQMAAQTQRPFSFEQRVVTREGGERTLQQRGEVKLDGRGRVSMVLGTAQDITERKAAERQLETVHRELLEYSRAAGMAEVATGVLHNVGNVLNSVNVSVALIGERLNKSRLSHLHKVSELLTEQAGDLERFFREDPRARKLPAFVAQLAERLAAEQGELQSETEGLAKNVAHIKEIVSVQQNYARVSGMTEVLPVLSLVEDALQMNGAAFDRHKVEVLREYLPVPPVRVDKHKVLQILINIIRNAKYAVSESSRMDKQMIVRVEEAPDRRVRISVADNGIGIAPEHLNRIFAHGFTTKKTGHGFGLHSAALAAQEMGGTLTAFSSGDGQGATFTLELPIEEAPAMTALAA